jgi:hypothetical protein
MDYIKVWVMANNKQDAVAIILRNLFQVAVGMNSIINEKDYDKYAI